MKVFQNEKQNANGMILFTIASVRFSSRLLQLHSLQCVWRILMLMYSSIANANSIANALARPHTFCVDRSRSWAINTRRDGSEQDTHTHERKKNDEENEE